MSFLSSAAQSFMVSGRLPFVPDTRPYFDRWIDDPRAWTYGEYLVFLLHGWMPEPD